MNYGFTLVEVMVFLAISGFMFMLAAVFINNKQADVAFRQGIQSAASTITNAINTVANGEYPGLGDFSCTATSGAPSFHITNASQGTNSGCIFLGKVLKFNTGDGPTSYETYTVAGRQFKAGSEWEPVQTFADAKPLAVSQLTEADRLQHGLAFESAYVCQNSCSGSDATKIGALGLFGSFGSYNGGSANSQASGAQDVSVAALMQTNVVADLSNTNNIKQLATGQYITLCFAYGNRIGEVVIGGQNGQQTSVKTSYNKELPC